MAYERNGMNTRRHDDHRHVDQARFWVVPTALLTTSSTTFQAAPAEQRAQVEAVLEAARKARQ